MAKKILPDTDTFLIAAAAGLILGTILSYLFGSLALPSKIPYQFTISGFSTNLIVVDLLVIVLVSAIIFLSYVAAIVRDVAFPTKHPWLFLTETAIVAFVPASVIYIMTNVRTTRVINFSDLNANFLLLAAKFGIFHLLFQFSGVYSYFFS
jgi:hypothetical protein